MPRLFLVLFFGLAALSTTNIWPLPNKVEFGKDEVFIDSYSFNLTMTTHHDDVEAAFNRMKNNIFKHRSHITVSSEIKSVIIDIHSVSTPLSVEVDESYTLKICKDGSPIEIVSQTIYGAYHALKTLSQLIVFDTNTETYIIHNAPWTIQDRPAFSHRGLLLNTGDHYLSKPTLKKVIDSMYYNKLNVLHWQLSSPSSLPFQSSIYEYLWEGSFSEEERYTNEDIREIIDYSSKRGIRVIPEYSVMSHPESWCLGYPDLCPSIKCQTAVNPAANITMYLLTDVLQEWIGVEKEESSVPLTSFQKEEKEEDEDEQLLHKINEQIRNIYQVIRHSLSPKEEEEDNDESPVPEASYSLSMEADKRPALFSDAFVHLAGDEINTECWKNTPSIVEWLKQNKFSELQGYFYLYDQLHSIVEKTHHKTIIYDLFATYFEPNLWKNTVIQSINPETNFMDFLQKGYDVILSNSQQWNVDIKENTWQNVYNYDFTSQLKNKTFTGHLLGGELMASTHLIDTSDLFSSLYPALSAVAEKLWSEESTAVSKVENIQARHSTFRYYLMERGIYSVPITTKNIRDPPDCPGSYFSQ